MTQITQKKVKYSVFLTRWGYLGLAGTENVLEGTFLPSPNPQTIEKLILTNFPNADRKTSLFEPLHKRIKAYFKAQTYDFSDISVDLEQFTSFQRAVLSACRTVTFGNTITYAGLAKKIGRHLAARAVGNALAANPLPLIIPCHRVICADGRIGKFSAPGGTKMKQKLLNLEKTRIV